MWKLVILKGKKKMSEFNKKDYNMYSFVFDLETTGLDINKHIPIEISMIPVAFSKKKKKYVILKEDFIDTLIIPFGEYEVDKKAMEVNKIDISKIAKRGHKIEKVVEVIIEMAVFYKQQRSRNLPMLIGHNIDSYDIRFLKKMFDYCNKDIYDYFNKSTFDTYNNCRLLLNHVEGIVSYSLVNLCKYFGIRNFDAHKSYNDSYANAELFCKIMNLFKHERIELLKL